MSFASALQLTRPNRSADLLTLLNDFLLRVSEGPVVLLRPLPNDFDSRRDDVDLLLTAPQRSKLLSAVFEASVAGQLHMRVRQACDEKAELVLWNPDCTSSLTVDLWSAFNQLPHHRRKVIRADHLLSSISPDSQLSGSPLNATIQMPADLDLCLFVLHLASKQKPLASPVVRQRLLVAFDRLRRLSLEETDSALCLSDVSHLLTSFEPLLCSVRIPPHLVRDAETYLLKRVRASSDKLYGPIPESRGRRGLLTKTRRWLMTRVPCLAIVGSDGAGKSSVCETLAKSQASNFEPCVGKKLYRRSLLYQLLSGLAKRIGGIERGDFDDQKAGWITLRASFSLWFHFAVRPAKGIGLLRGEAGAFGWAVNDAFSTHPRPSCRRTLLLDRSVASFLIVDRKTQNPQRHRSASWLERLLPPVTTVLLAVPFSLLSQRKQEMSHEGHERYQWLLFQQAMRQKPVDVIVVANTRSVDDAARVIRMIRGECHESAVSVPVEEAAA